MWWALHDPGVRPEIEAAASALADTPVFLMHATDDRTVSVGAFRRWATLLPHAERHELASGGHQFPIRVGADALVSWLEREP
jgi:pimeloyl-ACP methyl ester carboxylesterase